MTSTGAPPAALYRNRDFLRLWTGQVASDMGTNSAQLVVPLLILGATDSAAWARALTTVGAAVTAAGRLPGGAIADRLSRRRLMVLSNLGRMLLSLALGVCLLLNLTPLWFVVIVVVVSAVLEILFAPAETAAIPRVVPAEQLKTASAGNEARRSGASLAGPALGGLLYSVGQAVPFIINSLSYAISALSMARIKTPLQEPRTSRPDRSVTAEIQEGIAHVAGDSFLLAVVLIAAPLNFALTGAIFCATVSLQQADATSSEIGLAKACVGASGLAGALAASHLIRVISTKRLAILVCSGLSIASLASAAMNGHFVMILPLAAGFFLAPAVNAAFFAQLGSTTPDLLLSRVISVITLTATASAALAPGVCGLLTDAHGTTVPLMLCAGLESLALIIAASSNGLSHTRSSDKLLSPPESGHNVDVDAAASNNARDQ